MTTRYPHMHVTVPADCWNGQQLTQAHCARKDYRPCALSDIAKNAGKSKPSPSRAQNLILNRRLRRLHHPGPALPARPGQRQLQRIRHPRTGKESS